MNLHTGQPDPKMEHAVLKTIAAFMNSKGGTLFVGVNDDGEAIGLKQDSKKIFDLLYARKDEIENRFGAELNWLRLDDKKSSRISYGQAFDGSDQEKWPEISAWLVAHIQRLEKAFAPALAQVRSEMKQG